MSRFSYSTVCGYRVCDTVVFKHRTVKNERIVFGELFSDLSVKNHVLGIFIGDFNTGILMFKLYVLGTCRLRYFTTLFVL